MSRRARVSLGVVDQGLSSASNVLVTLALARVSTVSEFGVAALLLMMTVTALALARGCLGTPLLLTAARGVERVDVEAAHAVTAALGGGLVSAPLIAGTGWLLGEPALGIAFAVAVPFVLGQDVQRLAVVSDGRPGLAVRWDGVWAVGAALTFGATVLHPAAPSWAIAVAWGALAAVSLVGLAVQTGRRPVTSGWRRWWRANRADRLRYGAEAGIGTASSLVVVGGAAALAGTVAAAALRGAGTVLGPLSLLMAAVPVAVLPEVVRSELSQEQTVRVLRRVAVGLSAVAVGVGVVGWLLPDVAGRALLGDTWFVAAPLLPVTALEYVGLAWVTVVFAALRAGGRSDQLLRARASYALLTVVLSLTAAAVWGSALAVAWALALSAAVTAVLGQRFLRPGAPWRRLSAPVG